MKTADQGSAAFAADDRRRWLVALGGGAAASLLLTGLFQGPLPALTPDAQLPKARVEVVTPTEQTLMRDTIPLFLPTEHDAAVALSQPAPDREYRSYDIPKLSFGLTSLSLANTLPPTVTLNGKPPAQAKPADTLTTEVSGRSLQGFGQVEVRLDPLENRGGLLEVISTADGQRVLAEVLTEAAPPSGKEWQPMEFLIAVNASGLVGPLVPIEGSRVEEVDAYFKKFLVQNCRLGARLPPGSYRVIVGP